MGLLNNTNIVVDAVLTRKGRELLARGMNEFNITHFALADDEIDYSLWNPDHPLGTSHYGATIEAMPITEAVVDETQVMRHKLVTLPKKTIRIPVVSVPNTTITLNPGQDDLIRPDTINYKDGNSTYGYTAVLSDSDVAILEVVEPTIATRSLSAPLISSLETGQSVSLIGKTFRIRAKGAISSPKTTTLTIYGNETGGQVVMTINVNKQSVNGTSSIVGNENIIY